MRWLDQVEEDLEKMNVRNWREKCKDRRLWNEIVKQAKTHQGLLHQLKKKKKKCWHIQYNPLIRPYVTFHVPETKKNFPPRF